jgi:hypothetical protein
LREEDEDGGLLFNPDTNQVKIVNATGLFIWKQFESARPLNAVVEAIQQTFDGAPQDVLTKDVSDFVTEMLQMGFLGIVKAD